MPVRPLLRRPQPPRVPGLPALAALLCLGLGLLAAAPPDPGPATTPANPLRRVRHFMYQLQGLERPQAVATLAASGYDMLVVEPTFTVKGNEDFDAAGMVRRLKAGRPDRLVIAYACIGEAESYRTYWTGSWRPPTRQRRGTPDFLLIPDPDGWGDNYPVAYWDRRWQDLWLGAGGPLDRIMAAGFDGLYLDWVDAFDEPRVAAEARRQGVEPARAMVDFIAAIRARAQERNPRAVLIAQNAPFLVDADPRYARVIDGIGFEDTWFGGKAGAGWDSPRAGDLPNKARDEWGTAGRLRQYAKYRQAGLPVFTIDYCVQGANAALVYERAGAAGLVSLVTRVSLQDMTPTPPPALAPAAPPAPP